MAVSSDAEAFRRRIGIRLSDHITKKRRPAWRDWPTDTALPEYSEVGSSLKYVQNPVLEDHALLEWGIKQSGTAKGAKAAVDVMFGHGSDLNWRYAVDDRELEGIVSDTSQIALSETNYGPRPHVRVFFINTLESGAGGWLPGNFSLRPNILESLRRAGFSNAMLCGIFSSEGFWAKMGNQCFLRQDENGCLSSFEVCYRYVCGWDTGVGFTQFIRTRHQRTYFCINYPWRARRRLEAYLQHDPLLAHREFFFDALAADDCLKEWQINIGDRRESLLRHERKYDGEDIDFKTATRDLHRMAMHWHTLQQDFMDLQIQLKFFQDVFKKYMTNLQDPKNQWYVDSSSNNTQESLEVLMSQCDNYTRWTIVYKDRTNVRINLLFHLANQRESRTSTQIAASTAKVAEQTRRDSASMITIAAVTMLFLPGTFISAILSTTFFEFGHEQLVVSKQWWIIPAATIPLMVAVFSVWVGWQYTRFGSRGGLKVA